jgi:hypothetical protein
MIEGCRVVTLANGQQHCETHACPDPWGRLSLDTWRAMVRGMPHADDMVRRRCAEVAFDEIDRLRAEVERLRAALFQIANPMTHWPTPTDRGNPLMDCAREALKRAPGPTGASD